MYSRVAKLLTIFFLTLTISGLFSSTRPESSQTNCPQTKTSSEPVLAIGKIPNSKRDEIYLNGTWQFIPAVGSSQQEPPKNGWGSIWVPGDWQRENHNSFPGLIKRSTSSEWENFEGKTLSKAWYQRSIDIPANWAGRAIILDISRISTDALVYVNGINCGQINWPYGAVDITKAVKPGSTANISLLVVAAADEKETSVLMGPTEIYTTEAQLNSRGLIGEVRLLARPVGAHVSDVFVQTSTRQKQIKLDIELSNVTQAGQVNIVAKMFDEKGNVERQFTATANVAARPNQVVQVAWDWPNPRLWDVGTPNLYWLRLSVQGSGIDDEYDQRFGFREFWIEGRKFYLNGKEIRFRPLLHDDEWRGWGVGVPEVIDRLLDSYCWAGFNIAELWPWNHDERGRWHFRELFAERADLKGFPIMAPALSMTHLYITGKWKDELIRNRWQEKMVADLRRYRNHPSILMWANSPNLFGHGDDQNPLRIGKKKVEGTLGADNDKRWQQLFPIGEAVVSIIKKYDPTRPVMVHQGAAVGDVYALNSYLNIIPLQEREEWLSHWVHYGDMPYMVVEFGTPFSATMMRGRNGFRNAIASEPLVTEYNAIYLGKEAYQLETPEYRQKIREFFIKEQKYKSWHNQSVIDFSPGFQKLQQLFITNTWRSWRTFGITGGMIPWQNAYGWQASEAGKEMVNIGPFQKGRRGPYVQKVRKSLWYNFQLEGNIIQPAGIALMENNSPTLAYLAGSKTAFTAKDHNYYTGEKLQKQVVLINDTRQKQPFDFEWKVLVSGSHVGSGKKVGSIETAETLFFPIEVNLPKNITSEKVDGEIILEARIGSKKHRDRFPFRVFKLPQESISQKSEKNIAVFDTTGKTTAMLKQLGYSVVPWDGSQTPSLIAIAREALSNKQKLPGNLETFIRNGGRAIIFAQNPEWIRNTLGFRVAPHLSRRVFPIDETHPALKGLDEIDLRDWRGESTLVVAYPNTLNGGVKLSPHGSPWYGWHWGNRGALSSAAIEKPHLSGWRAILESEFDLAYSPLMELDYGKGRLILNTLDLEDYYTVEPAAAKIAKQIIDYALTAPLSPKTEKVILIGSDANAAQLDAMGLIYQRSDTLENDAGLVIIGAGANIKEETLRNYISAGGKVFFMPQYTTTGVLGMRGRFVKNFGGSINVPKWAETRGISASDLRARSYYDAWILEAGGEKAANGLLSRVVLGKGVAIFSQIDPNILNADEKTYLRLTRWRHTRAIAQILANMGASFKADSLFFEAIANADKGKHSESFYHPDFKSDFELGDDPYRYYRW
ncbi:MAG: beta-galactosidase [Oscillatoriaceae bacterium SKW80]|nr:beta-galactosidase [Oscillatoriaceae bacterium SKYG93]MCX8119911.1 beta-galactosidase [Oscillatoriaceae bacterium SKW80]MDW8451844.1 beta-galactosidase [Oscillatoriaceae cyanobacterium SKYGB_i_bin93]HIK27576.1 beta-galactosidase [Oscillatoriaceae cyanobacterium M7585_C2015_266]